MHFLFDSRSADIRLLQPNAFSCHLFQTTFIANISQSNNRRCPASAIPPSPWTRSNFLNLFVDCFGFTCRHALHRIFLWISSPPYLRSSWAISSTITDVTPLFPFCMLLLFSHFSKKIFLQSWVQVVCNLFTYRVRIVSETSKITRETAAKNLP